MTTRHISDAELDRLDELLCDPAFDEAMRIDQVQGYLCAAMAGPVPIPEAERLAEILGSEEAISTPAGQEVAQLLKKFTDDLIEEIEGDGESLMLYLFPKSDEENAPSDYEPWCLAYLCGIDAAEKSWRAGLSEDEENWLDEQLLTLMVLSGEAEAAARKHGEEWPEGDERRELIADAEESLARVVTEIHRFWLAKRGGGTVRREAPKVGRNDPCPCGSGKKFKQCCGKAG